MSAYGLISSSLLLIGLFNIFLTLHTLKEYLRGNRIVLHLMLATFFAALYCLFGSLTYFLASIHADYHLTYKICWIGYLTIPGFFHLAYSMRGTPLKWHKALVNGLYAFWAVIMVLLVTTDLIDIAPTQIIPYGEIEGRF